MAKKKGNGTPTQAPVKIENFTRNLRCELNDKEVSDAANLAAHRLADCDRRELEIKEETKRQKTALETMQLEVRTLSDQVRSRAAYRDVRCERRYDYERGIVLELRMDTGEVLEERPMIEAEKQPDLPGVGGGENVDDEFEEAQA